MEETSTRNVNIYDVEYTVIRKDSKCNCFRGGGDELSDVAPFPHDGPRGLSSFGSVSSFSLCACDRPCQRNWAASPYK